MKMIRVIGACAVAAAALLPLPASAQETTFKFLTGWDQRFPGTPLIAYEYGKILDKATSGRLKAQFFGPETVAPNQQFEPISRGVFDMSYSTPVYYLGTTGLPTVAYALEANTENWRKKGYWDIFDQELQRFNQKLIAFVAAGTAYQLMLTKPLDNVEKPLAGRKIRANGFYRGLVEPGGGAMVNLDGGEIYAALQKGVVDGAAWPVLGAINFKWYEVAKYMSRPLWGVAPYTVTMNLDRFNKLSKADQELVLKLGREVEASGARGYEAQTLEEAKQLKEKGVQETHFDPKTFATLQSGFDKAVWNLAIGGNAKTKDRVIELYAKAKANGDAPANLE
jgi:TRAP-type C4-dicarboxylate transport system substrate-binding protein